MSDNPNFNGMSLKGIPRLLRAMRQYKRERRGPMTSNFAECGGFLKTSPDLEVPDIQLHFGMAMADDHGRKRHRGTGFSLHVCLLRPKSRGNVALGSADPLAAPLIDPNFLGDAADLETMVAGYKVTKRLLETPALRALQKKDMFTEGVETDDQIRGILRQRVDTVYHPVGTARMGSDRDGRGRCKTQGARPRRPARRRCLRDADPDRRQHQCADHHDRREGRRHDQGRDAGGVI